MSNEKRTYHDWLRGERLRRGMTQQQAAERAEMARSYWNRIETGGVRLPTWEVRARIHEALGTSEADLIRAGVDIDAGAEIVRASRLAASTPEDVFDLDNPLVRAVFLGAQDLTEKGWRMLAAYAASLREFEGKPSFNEEQSPREGLD